MTGSPLISGMMPVVGISVRETLSHWLMGWLPGSIADFLVRNAWNVLFSRSAQGWEIDEFCAFFPILYHCRFIPIQQYSVRWAGNKSGYFQ